MDQLQFNSSFESIYRAKISKIIGNLNIWRKGYLILAGFLTILTLFIILPLINHIHPDFDPTFRLNSMYTNYKASMMILGLAFGMIILVCVLFKNKMKQKLTPILHHFFPINAISYNKSTKKKRKWISFNKNVLPDKPTVFDLTKLFYPSWKEIISHESFTGKHQGLNFVFFDIECNRYSHSGRYSQKVTLFRGIVIEINCSKLTADQFIITNTDCTVPANFTSITFEDDKPFTDHYKTYAQNPNSITNILTPKFRQDILNNAYYNIARLENTVYIFIKNEDPFEFKLNIFKNIDKNIIHSAIKNVVFEINAALKCINIFSENNLF